MATGGCMNAVNPAAAVGHESTVELPAMPGLAPALAMPGTRVDGQGGSQTIPRQRQPESTLDPASGEPVTTAVLPYAGSWASRRTRWVRAWMVAAPVDVAALLSP